MQDAFGQHRGDRVGPAHQASRGAVRFDHGIEVRAVDFDDRPASRRGIARLRCVRLREAQVTAASRVPWRHLRAVVEPRARQSRQVALELCAQGSVDDHLLQTTCPTSATRAASAAFRGQRVDEPQNSASAGATLPSDGGTRASMKISIAASVRAASDGSSRPAALCASQGYVRSAALDDRRNSVDRALHDGGTRAS